MQTNHTNRPQHQKKKTLNNYGRYTGIAIQMMVIIAGGTFGGYKLDQWLAMRFPVFTLVAALLSIAIAIYLAIKDFIKIK